MHGGGEGERGLNLLIRKPKQSESDSTESEASINLGGKNTVQVNPGDRILIRSPGGGGYGVQGSDNSGNVPLKKNPLVLSKTGGSVNQYVRDQEGV